MELLRMDDQRYDVFICFRGDEPFGTSTIRRAIVEPLFDSLTRLGASAFMDNETIEHGRDIPDTILQGILQTQGAALILVSPDFFSRVWPLIEMACFYRLRNDPEEDQIHLFIVCLNTTPNQIKQAAFVKDVCPAITELKFVVAPDNVDTKRATKVVQWLSETMETWIQSEHVALGRTKTESFSHLKSRLVNMPNQREIGETIATHLELNDLLVSGQSINLSNVFAAATLARKLTEDIIYLEQVLSGLRRDGKFCVSVDMAFKHIQKYKKKWLSQNTANRAPLLFEEIQNVQEWFRSSQQNSGVNSSMQQETGSSLQEIADQPTSQTNQPQDISLQSLKTDLDSNTFQARTTAMRIVQILPHEDLMRLFHAAPLNDHIKAILFVVRFLCWKYKLPVAKAFGNGSMYLAFENDVDLTAIHANNNVKLVEADKGIEFEVNATNTWSWPLTLDEHGVLNDIVRNNLALLIASFGLEGICKFRVHQILSNEEKDHFAVFFMPPERDIQTARSIVEQEGFMEKFEKAYNAFGSTAKKGQVTFCGGCGVVQRTSPENPYLCRLGHLQAVHILDQPIPQEKAVGFEWMPHNLDRRVDLLISCEQLDKIVSSLKNYFLHDTYSVITSENRDMSSFLQAVLSTRGGGIALVLMTKNYMKQSRTVSELACLYEVRQDIRLIIACVGTTKSQVLQNVIIQELCPDLSSHLFLEYDTEDSVDSFLKNQISQELLQHVIPGFRRDQSYLILKDHLATCFANSAGRAFAKIAIKLDLESNSVMNWSDLFKQAELHGKFGEEQMGQLRQAILTLSETELNSNHRTAALKIIQQYEKKWLADWTSKKVPALDKIGERVLLVKTKFENFKSKSQFQAPFYKTLTGHTDTVRSVAFSPDSKLIASASWDRTVRLWNIPNGDLNAELERHTNWVSSVAFSPDGKSIVTGSADQNVRTWSIATKQQVQTLNGHSSIVWSVAWSPNGALIASGSEDTTVILWDATSGSKKKKLKGHKGSVYSVSFSHNGNKLASGGWDNTAIIWDVNSGAALIKLVHSELVLSICFSSDDRFFVTGCNDNIMRMFDANNGREEKRFEGHTSSVISVACSVDGSMIASGSRDKSVRLWDVASTKQLQQLDGHTNLVWSVAFSRDDNFIASGSEDTTVRLWNVPLLIGKEAELKTQKQEEHHLVEMGEQNVPLVEQQEVAHRDEAESLVSQPSNAFKIVNEHSDDEDDKPLSKKPRMENGEDDEVAKKIQQKVNLVESDASSTTVASKTNSTFWPWSWIPPVITAFTSPFKSMFNTTPEAEPTEPTPANSSQPSSDRNLRNSFESRHQNIALVNSHQVAEWSATDICNYLKQKRIDDHVIEIFRNENIKGIALAKYGDEELLKRIGIKRKGDRMEVIIAINQIVASPSFNGGFKVHEIPRRELTKDTKLSEGNFGIVWRGTYTGIPVAIKEPKLYGAELNPKKQLADLVEEATVMTSISNHPNVLHCYGISRVGEDDYLLVTELCNLGSLESFLRIYPGTPAIDRRRFAQQVARGLNHLGKHNVAHRNVAARNVLLHDQGGGVVVAKVCDFGLSRQREGEYYMVTGQHLILPDTAPDGFTTGKHSSRSDVWSFGVLLWEVESLCATRAKPNKAAFPPLSKPAQASDNIYEIMLKCWAKDPHQRPSFEALVDLLA